MANNDELIYKSKALKDLRGIKDVLMSQGDPFLAGVMNRAIECIENQPAAAAQPVRGEWIVDKERMTATCSNCGKTLRFRDEMQIAVFRDSERFCYYCGAHMTQEAQHATE